MLSVLCCLLLVSLVTVQGGLLYGYPEKLGGHAAYGGYGYGAYREGLGHGAYGEALGYGGKLGGGYFGGYGGKLHGGYHGGYGYREGPIALGKGVY